MGLSTPQYEVHASSMQKRGSRAKKKNSRRRQPTNRPLHRIFRADFEKSEKELTDDYDDSEDERDQDGGKQAEEAQRREPVVLLLLPLVVVDGHVGRGTVAGSGEMREGEVGGGRCEDRRQCRCHGGPALRRESAEATLVLSSLAETNI